MFIRISSFSYQLFLCQAVRYLPWKEELSRARNAM